ncbi:MAG: family 10 glycosylhydrolase [bacterium]|nr:family 10 glycosylhydrolase [bacterium]
MTVIADIAALALVGSRLLLHSAAGGGDRVALDVWGIWAECEGANASLSSRAKIEEMFDRLERAGFNTVFIQVYRGDRAWYRSDLADAGPYEEFRAREKSCPLDLAIRLAHAKGMEIHAWMNMYRVWGRADAKVIRRLGREAVTRDRSGRSMLDYPRGDLPDGGYWLEPGDPAVRAHLLAVMRELLDRYPSVDGLHLDYVRYPYDEKGKTDFGYGTASVAAFGKAHGAPPPGKAGGGREQWDAWRRRQVALLIADAKRLTASRGKTLSAAVIPGQRKSRSVVFQDWAAWLREGTLDLAVPMNYSASRKTAAGATREALAAAGGRGRVAIGLGAYKVLDSPEALLDQIRDCRRLGASGAVLFSHDNLAKRPDLFRSLGRGVRGRPFSPKQGE